MFCFLTSHIKVKTKTLKCGSSHVTSISHGHECDLSLPEADKGFNARRSPSGGKVTLKKITAQRILINYIPL
jgi:hypothetical protein